MGLSYGLEVLRSALIVNPEILVLRRRFFSLQSNVLLYHFVGHIARRCYKVPSSPHVPMWSNVWLRQDHVFMGNHAQMWVKALE